MTAPAFTPGPWRVEEGTTLVWGACNPDDRSTYGMGYPVTQARVRLGAATEYASEFREDEAEANARLISAAPDYAVACGLDLDPAEAATCGPLAWLRSAIDTLSEDGVKWAASGDDPDAYATMLTECSILLERLQEANRKASA